MINVRSTAAQSSPRQLLWDPKQPRMMRERIVRCVHLCTSEFCRVLCGMASEVETLYLRSRAIAAAQEMAPFVAHCDLRIAKLHALVHDDARSRAALRRARKAFDELKMPYWADRAQQALMRLAHA